MRLDRLITLGLVQPLQRSLGLFTQHATRNTHLPVLMYHSISDDPEPGVRPYYRTCTSPAVFRRQMRYLADSGYKTITVSEVASILAQNGKPQTSSLLSSLPSVENQSSSSFSPFAPVKYAVLTFDDGFADFYTHGFPVLQEFGFTATVFLPTAFIGNSEPDRRLFAPACSKLSTINHKPSTARSPHPGEVSNPSTINSQQSTSRPCLTWSEVKELHRAGIQMGSHTVNHPKLVDLSWDEIRAEISNSKSEIENRLGESVTSFCYPYAFPQANQKFISKLQDLLKQSGYSCCATTKLGRAWIGDDLFKIKRLPINSCDDEELFTAKLDGAYDWLGAPQAGVKKYKHRLAPRRKAKVPSVSGLAPMSID